MGPSDLIFMNSQLVVKATPDEDKRIAELLAILNYQTSARDEGNRKTK